MTKRVALYFCHVKVAVPTPTPGDYLVVVVPRVDMVASNIGVVLVVNVVVVVVVVVVNLSHGCCGIYAPSIKITGGNTTM
jgi:hypothetical protein